MNKIVPKGELICCQMVKYFNIRKSNTLLPVKSDSSNVITIYVNNKTMKVYDENNKYIGIAKRKFGSEMSEIKLEN